MVAFLICCQGIPNRSGIGKTMYLVHSQLRAAGEADLHWNVTHQESELEQASYNPPGWHALALVPYISTYFAKFLPPSQFPVGGQRFKQMSLREIFYIRIIVEESSKHQEETGRAGLFMTGASGGSAPWASPCLHTKRKCTISMAS